MAEPDEQPSSETEAQARQLGRLFETDRPAAMARFKKLLADQAQAGRILQQLIRLDRYGAAVAMTDAVVFDAKTPEAFVIERARALSRSGYTGQAQAEELLSEMSPLRPKDYSFHFSAGRVFAEMRRPKQALDYFEAAFRIKPTNQVSERIFQSLLALERTDQAVAAMARITRSGTYRDALSKDFAYLIRALRVGELDPDLAVALGKLPGAEAQIVPALVPHLVHADLMDGVIAAVEGNRERFSNWDDDALTSVVPYLVRHGRIDHLMRVFEQYDGTSAATARLLAETLEAMPVAERARFLVPDLSGFAPADDKAWGEARARFETDAGAEAALAMLQRLPALIAKEQMPAFYAREKHRLARLARLVAEKRTDAQTLAALAGFALHWLDPKTAAFFSSSDFDELVRTVRLYRRTQAAAKDDRLGLLREGYFAFHLSRRSDTDIGLVGNDFDLADIAIEYFMAMALQRPALTVPVGAALQAWMGERVVALASDMPLNRLSACTLVRSRPIYPLALAESRERFLWWYVNGHIGGHSLPPDGVEPGMIAWLNEPVRADPPAGIDVTRFLAVYAGRAEAYRAGRDPSNLIDRFHLVADMIATVLSRNTHFLPFFEAFLNTGDSLWSAFLDRLGGAKLMHDTAEPVTVVEPDAPQDILLVGHASKQTGLGRNFHMLAQGLAGEGVALARLDFDSKATPFAAELLRWRRNCRTRPIAVFAVNANDVPDAFLKDRAGAFADCHCAGFYLWEVSRVPQVQSLGVSLVDEIWAPTAYVADVYAPLKPTHVVGKGLFRGDEPFLAFPPKARKQAATFRFATAFDFDSSIERKNPLAAALAFRAAFPAGENVELVVKTSNVNPRHWSNAGRQWERLAAVAAEDPRIKLVNRRYSDEEMTALVRDADCIVSLHRSEGFGYLAADAMAFGVPVIATDYSGSADYCTAETSFPVPYKLIAVPPGAARWRCEAAEWADADIDAAASQMRRVYERYDEALAVAARAKAEIVSRYSLERFAATLRARIDAIRAGRG
jgi:glycosyltransferase involved in cell wall biosynthesis